MIYIYLLTAGILVSSVHSYLVWRNRKNIKYTLSDNAVIDIKGYLIYLFTHVIIEILFLLYSYQFFIVEHNLVLPFIINIAFVVLDFVQAVLPSRGKTENIHILSAYVSWLCFLLSGTIALFALNISEPYKLFSVLLLIPIVCMFLYMHKLHNSHRNVYIYQLIVVPMYVIYLLMVTVGAK